MKDDELVIQNWPSCFEEFAWKHNRLVYLLRSMQGRNGITVAVADANILISTTGGAASGDPWHVIGSDGKLGNVQKHSSWTAGTTYPTALGVVTASTTVLIDVNGISVSGGSIGYRSGTTSITANSSGVSITGGYMWVANGAQSITAGSTGWEMKNTSGKTCKILFNALTYDMSVREIDVCDAGIAKKMLVLASAAYT
jgi:hypothetical protein